MVKPHIPEIANCIATVHIDTQINVHERQPEFEMTQALINTLEMNLTAQHVQLGESIAWIDKEKRTLQGIVELNFELPPETQLNEVVSNLEGLIQQVVINNLTIGIEHWSLDALHFIPESSNFTIPLTERID